MVAMLLTAVPLTNLSIPPAIISWCNSCPTSMFRALVTVEWRCGGALLLEPLSREFLSNEALPVEVELRLDQLHTCT
jgi:hypothetical protein